MTIESSVSIPHRPTPLWNYNTSRKHERLDDTVPGYDSIITYKYDEAIASQKEEWKIKSFDTNSVHNGGSTAMPSGSNAPAAKPSNEEKKKFENGIDG